MDQRYNGKGIKENVAVCGLSGEPVLDKVCHIYDDVVDMKVKFNRITISKKKTFLEEDLIRLRDDMAKVLGLDSSEIYFNYSRIG